MLERTRRRHASDVVRVVLGVLALALASLPVRPDTIGRVETGAFDVVNGLPDWLLWVLWGPMQLGSLVAVGAVAVAALLLRRRGLAIESAVAGMIAWTVAKVVKDGFGRPRPGGLLEQVVLRGEGQAGFGFVSGHSAVAFALATVASLYVPRRWRGWLFGLAWVVGLSRIFVGAHLPLDVIGGAGTGWAIAAALRLVLGAATGRPPLDQVRAGIERLGMPVRDIVPLASSARTSAVYRVFGADGDFLAKVVGDRPQDRDVLHRWWVTVSRREPPGAQRFASPHLQVTYEATRMLAAAAAGVRVPEVVYAGRLDPEHAVLLTRWVPGQTVRSVGDLDRPAADDARVQVDRLHAARIAHGDLTGHNMLVDGNRVTLVDFGDAALLADDEALQADRTLLDETLAAGAVRSDGG